MSRKIFTKATTGTLALAFLLGIGGEVYGLHDCPRHHHDGPESRQVVPETETVSSERTASGAHLPSESTPEGPCTCVGTCHASAASPHPGVSSSTALPSAASARTRAPHGRRFLPPLRSPYLLPYANGPPVSAI